MCNRNMVRHTEKEPQIWTAQPRKLEPKPCLSKIFSRGLSSFLSEEELKF